MSAGGSDAAARVISTAGHVDHGKSALIEALTGTHPDRLREERERGMTIDLGFAHLRLPGGREIGIVDVPGHQDFIRNMLAGVGSIDAVLLVVAADEGVMPQTREHIAILSLLGVARGVIALTKCDLVDEEWLALAAADVRAAVEGTPLADAPIVRVSAVGRVGLEQLVAEIDAVLAAAPPRREIGRPRLPIDRAFTMAGFGTVVTGTLVDGAFALGDEVEIVPGERRARIRGLQTHGRSLERAGPGRRLAMNLSGVDKGELERGMNVVLPGTLAPSAILGARVTVIPSSSGSLVHDDLVKLHAGTAEVMARVSVLEGQEIAAGSAGWVQLRLASPVVAVAGDRVVLRRASPSETIGGGEIADVGGARARRRSQALAQLTRRAGPTTAARVLAVLDEPRSRADVASRTGLAVAEVDQVAADLMAQGSALELADALISRDAHERMAQRVERTLALGHRRAPLRSGVPREEVRAALGLAPKRAAALFERLATEGRVAERGTALALPSHRPALSADQEALWGRAREALAASPLQPPSLASLETDIGIGAEVVAALVARGDLVRAGDAAFLPQAVAGFAHAILAELATSGKVTVARARDLSGSSRKHVLPLLQFLDDHGITRRVGDERVLVPALDEARATIDQLLEGKARS